MLTRSKLLVLLVSPLTLLSCGSEVGVPVGLAKISVLAAGGASNCRIAGAGAPVACWGLNDLGQLGIGNSSNTAIPTTVGLGGQRSAVGLSMGTEHACAVLDDGSVACWGSNSEGQLGVDASIVKSLTPRLVSGITGARSVGVGAAHTCIIGENAAVICWGSNAKGQTGQAQVTPGQEHLPRQIPGLSATAISSGVNHVCALTPETHVTCWGDNQYGQLGNGTNTDSSLPVSAGTISGVVTLGTGSHHSCAANKDRVYCWGRNDSGQIGSNGTVDRNFPVETQTAMAGVVQIAAGTAHTCTLNGSTIQCWGSNNSKQLSGSSASGTTPVSVPLSVLPRRLAAGSAHNCAQDNSDTTWCWGAGSQNRLGPNATSDSSRPIFVP